MNNEAFPLQLFEYVYRNGSKRIIFEWVARDQDDADEAFVEVLGVHPHDMRGVFVEEKPVGACRG